MHRSSRNAGIASYARSVACGAWMRPTHGRVSREPSPDPRRGAGRASRARRKQGPKDAQCHVIISRHDRGESSRLRSSKFTAGANPLSALQSPSMQGSSSKPTSLRALAKPFGVLRHPSRDYPRIALSLQSGCSLAFSFRIHQSGS